MRERVARPFAAIIATYALDVFNDQFFKETTMMLMVSAGFLQRQGIIQLVCFLPFVLLAAPSGWLADRFSKRSVVLAAKILELGAAAGAAWGVISGHWIVLLIALGGMGLRATIFSPAINGSIPELFPAAEVQRANAQLKIFTTTSTLLGFVLAGVLLNLHGKLVGKPTGQVAIGGGIVLVALIGLFTGFGTPRRPAADPTRRFPILGPIKTLRELWRTRQDPLLFTAIGADTYTWFLGSLLLLLINALGLRQMHFNPAGTGLLVLAETLGVVIGGLLSTRLVSGARWYNRLPPSALLLGGSLLVIARVPYLAHMAQTPVLLLLLTCAGTAGGLLLIPLESFIQVRPPAAEKGTIISVANFAAFTGMLLAGPFFMLLLHWHLRPSACFAVAGALSIMVALGLFHALPDSGEIMLAALRGLVQGLLWLRYRIEVHGLDAVLARGTTRIAFFSAHQALIDPIIMMSVLHKDFQPRSVADRDAGMENIPLVRRLFQRFGVRYMPTIAKQGMHSRQAIVQVLEESITGINEQGENLLLYPAGHILRSQREEIGANSAVESIVRGAPEARVVLVRMRGLWGSSFSNLGAGRDTLLGAILRKACAALLLNGIVFTPRRTVTLEFVEPRDFPRQSDRLTINRYLEAFYNQPPLPRNTYVPYTVWERTGTVELPEPPPPPARDTVSAVPASTRAVVQDYLTQLSGVATLQDSDRLAHDLNLDSLLRAELLVWLESEFGFPPPHVEALQTVADVLAAACGEAISGGLPELQPVPANWFTRANTAARLALPAGATITDLFLQQARRAPGRVIVADQSSGTKSYRELITGILALLPRVRQLPGENLGIMLPASVAAVVAYLTVLFAGKTPVMVNWTVGRRNLLHALDTLQVQHLLTTQPLLTRLEAQGMDLAGITERCCLLEVLAREISGGRRLRAWLAARMNWRALRKARIAETAAILFTSGSENLPKAVPLTHANMLANLSDLLTWIELRETDSLLGILPPFHSFGLTANMLVAICAGLPTVFSPNPVDGAMLARILAAYRVRLLVGTPTFLHGIVRAAAPEQLASLRLAVAGAEECPAQVYTTLAERSPSTVLIEGYGITECSPCVAINDASAPRPGAIGYLLPSYQHALIDPETRMPVPRGAMGLLLLRGPSVFAGYLGVNPPDPFIEYDGARWYNTGDLLSQSEDGCWTFHGRLQRFIKLGGEMISLPAIESVLRACTAETEDPALAVLATAYPELVLFTTLPLQRAEVNAQLQAAGLSALHNIRRVIRVEALPILGTGKTDYRALQQLLAAETTAPNNAPIDSHCVELGGSPAALE